MIDCTIENAYHCVGRLFGSEFEMTVKLHQFKILTLENVSMSLQVTGQRKAVQSSEAVLWETSASCLLTWECAISANIV